eukprot:GSMAST32.ASY1.ANO1.2680.1 assembled CDS
MADWIQWFGSMEGHDFFCQVDRSFIESRFNLYGLSLEVHNFAECLNIILDYVNSDSSSDDWNREEWSRKECMDLYGRIHARFLLTTHGQQLMFKKFKNEDFGNCPRILCNNYPVLPVGLSDIPGEQRVMVYCPKCQDVFVPPMTVAARYVDGAYFGCSFPHFLLMSYPEYVPPKLDISYTPTVFGYTISNTVASAQFPRIKDFRGKKTVSSKRENVETEGSDIVTEVEKNTEKNNETVS